MRELIEQLTTEAETNRTLLRDLKCAAVNSKLYELAAKLRDIETKRYPKSHTDSPEYKQARQFEVGLRMLDINASLPAAYKILALARVFDKMGGETDMESVAKIEAESLEIFGS